MKAARVLRLIAGWILGILAVLVFCVSVLAISVTDRPERKLLGRRYISVSDHAMKPLGFDKGDAVSVIETDTESLKVGDAVAFISVAEDSFGKITVRQIFQIESDETGRLTYAMGDLVPGSSAEDVIYGEQILGIYEFTVPYEGAFYRFASSLPGLLCCTVLPVFLLIVLILLSCRGSAKRKQEKLAQELKEYRQYLEEERKQNKRMIEDLIALRGKAFAEGDSSGDASCREDGSHADPTLSATRPQPVYRHSGIIIPPQNPTSKKPAKKAHPTQGKESETFDYRF